MVNHFDLFQRAVRLFFVHDAYCAKGVLVYVFLPFVFVIHFHVYKNVPEVACYYWVCNNEIEALVVSSCRDGQVISSA